MSWSCTAIFYEQLRVILQAGLPIADAVRHSGATAGGFYASHADGWSRSLSSGQPLSDILRSAGCPAFDVALIQAGEKSGHLPELCADIASHYRHVITLRNLVVSRLIYPAFLIHITLVAAAFPLVFMFGWPAWWLIAGPIMLWLVCALAWGGWRFLSPAVKARIALGKFLGYVMWPLFAANTCSVLRAALSAGMLAPDALELSAGACGNAELGERLRHAGSDVRQGRISDVTAALENCEFPDLVISLCRSGEKAGALDGNLGQANTVMRESFRMRSEWLARIVCGIIYGGAMLAAVVTVISFGLGYVGMLNAAIEDIG